MKYKKYLVIPVLAFSLVGVNSALAQKNTLSSGRGKTSLTTKQMKTKRLEQQAEILRISADDLKARLSQGKTIQEIASDLNITSADLRLRFIAAQINRLKTHLETQVKKGNLTQAQADTKLKNAEQKMSTKDTKAFGQKFTKIGKHFSR